MDIADGGATEQADTTVDESAPKPATEWRPEIGQEVIIKMDTLCYGLRGA